MNEAQRKHNLWKARQHYKEAEARDKRFNTPDEEKSAMVKAREQQFSEEEIAFWAGEESK